MNPQSTLLLQGRQASWGQPLAREEMTWLSY